jgi:FkbM family methyltransferase
MVVVAHVIDYVRAAKLDLELRASWRRRVHNAQGSTRIVEDVLRPGDVALDIGASWGHYTSAMARLVGDQGRVHAFEPNPANARQLSLIALKHRNVVVHTIGLSDAPVEADLHVPTRAGRAITELGTLGRIEAAAATATVPVRVERLDDLLGKDAEVAFVKCDVEGHEQRVLAGGARMLERCKPVILVEIERRHNQADVGGTIGWLEGRGYDAFMVSGEDVLPAEQFDPELHQPELPFEDSASLPAGHVSDFLFIPSSG